MKGPYLKKNLQKQWVEYYIERIQNRVLQNIEKNGLEPSQSVLTAIKAAIDEICQTDSICRQNRQRHIESMMTCLSPEP